MKSAIQKGPRETDEVLKISQYPNLNIKFRTQISNSKELMLNNVNNRACEKSR